MEIKFNGKTIELSFGLKFLNIIDKEMGMEAEQVNFGKGTEMLVPALESHSVVDVAKVIKAATAQEKGAPKTEEDLEAVVEDVIENTGLEEFCNEVIEELGKRLLTFDRIVILCMSKLKIYDLDVIERMTLREFNYRMYALEYEQLDKDMDMYKLAFAIRDAAAEKKKRGGKKGETEYRFKSADDIMHYQENIKRLDRGEPVKFASESKFEENMPPKELLQQIAELNK